MKIHESAEDYLETILKLERKNGHVRSVDIARELGYSKPSISRAMGKLRENGYILADRSGIKMTEKGRELALLITERHNTLREFLVLIGVPLEIASKDACRIEHVLSPETFEKFKEHYLEMKATKKAQ